MNERDIARSERDYRNLGHLGKWLSVCARPSQFVVTQAFSIAGAEADALS